MDLFKATTINILLLTTAQMTVCNMKGVACNQKQTVYYLQQTVLIPEL